MNIMLPYYHLVAFTWGNVSGIDRVSRLVAIKPSGVTYDELKPEDMVIVDLDGNIVEGRYRPSSDTATHLVFFSRTCPCLRMQRTIRSANLSCYNTQQGGQ